jgi:hypothetical protein
MYLSETLARDRYRETLNRAQEAREARQVAELNRAERQQERAERKMVEAWRRADELRAMLGATR